MLPTLHLKGDTSESLQEFYVLSFFLKSDTLKGKGINHTEYKQHTANTYTHNLLKTTVLVPINVNSKSQPGRLSLLTEPLILQSP
jgi:hypothetical protein